MTGETSHMLAGTTVPMVTVMSAPGQPSVDDALPLLAAMASARIDNVMLLGSNGEGALLSPAVTDDYLGELTAAWHRMRPGGRVLVNVSAAGTADVRTRAIRALNAGSDLLIVSPPSYFRHRDDEILSHIRSLEEFDVPFAVYNVPNYANPLSLDVFKTLCDTSSRFVGLKDSSGSMDTVRGFLAAAASREDIGLSQGDEIQLTEAVRAGAVGIVPGTANLIPGLTVQLWEAARSGDFVVADVLQAVTTALAGLHSIRPGVPAVKAILASRGFGPDFVAPPLARCSDNEREALLVFAERFSEHLVRK